MVARTILLTTLAVVIIAAAAFAQTVVIPRYTVIPAVLDTGLNSSTARIGDTVSARCIYPNCGGFPSATVFLGTVTDVVTAAQGRPGQIGVTFNTALLPNGNRLPIRADITSLDQNEVSVDPQTGRLTEKPQERNERDKFISSGAAAGAVIGSITSSNTASGAIKGGMIGAMTGWVAGRNVNPRLVYDDVNLPPGTHFGIILLQDVRVNESVLR